MSDYRAMSVPDGLVNLRADVALSRLLGVSVSYTHLTLPTIYSV